MTTELKKDQASGRYWLCESTEILAKPIISQDLKESLKISNGKAGTLIVKNIPVTILNRENMNGRIYTTQVLEEAIAECKRLNKFADKSMLGKGNEHPEDSFIAPTDASHAVINCYIKKNIPIIVEGKKERHDVLFQDWEIFNTHNGKDLRALIEAGASFGTSIRGLGDLEGKYVKNYSIISCDCVGNPSSSTFSGMPVAESVVESVNKDESKKPLNEEFVVSSSSTTVMKDLDQAARMALELDELSYGTVIKTSTKVDDETDPKTGVSTSLVTFEAETEDKATDLDTALMLAKRAILNGKVDIDSVTIENVKEDQPKESTRNGDEKALKEDDNGELKNVLAKMRSLGRKIFPFVKFFHSFGDNKDNVDFNFISPEGEVLYTGKLQKINGDDSEHAFIADDGNAYYGIDHPEQSFVSFVKNTWPETFTEDHDDEERYGKCSWCGDEMPLSDLKKEKDLGYVCNHCAKGLESREGSLDFEEDEYVPESKMTEAGEHYPDLNPNSPNNVRAKRISNIVSMLDYFINASASENEKNLAKDLKDKYVKAIHSDMSNEDLDEVLVELEKVMNAKLVEPLKVSFNKKFGITEAKEEKEEDPNTGKKFILKTPQGFVAMDGNALVFKQDPKEALHFIVGKEETGLVHLSKVQEILDTMGVYDVEKYYKKDITDISAPEEGNGIAPKGDSEFAPKEEQGNETLPESNNELTEDNGSNTRFSAQVAYDKGNGNLETDTVPVSGVELDSILAEVGNLYDMKSQKADGTVSIKVTDTQSGQVYQYNKQNNSLDPIQNADTNMADVQQEPQLDAPIQEANGEIEQKANELKVDLDKDHSVTKKFDTVAQASIAKAGMEQGKLNGDVMLSEEDQNYEDAPDYGEENVEFGWYALSPNTDAQGRPDLIGPFESEEEANNALAEVIDMVEIFEVTPDGIHQGNDMALAAESNLDEKIFSNPTNSSDEFVSVPLKDSDNLKFSLDNIDWDINSVVDKLYDGEFVDIDNLPDHLEVELTEEEFANVANVEELINVIKNKASEQIGIKINNAILDRIA